jgi:Mobilization protein NikA
MAADAFIQCRVTSETKALIHALARQQRITDSALVKQLLGIMLRSAVALGAPNTEPADSASRDARLYVRLDPNDRLLLKERAAARGVPSATYVAALVRSHLRGITPLMKEERLALDQVVTELTALGRNLNQIARALNRGQGVAPGRQEVQAMLRVCSALRDHVKALLAANAKNWDQGHAETAH